MRWLARKYITLIIVERERLVHFKWLFIKIKHGGLLLLYLRRRIDFCTRTFVVVVVGLIMYSRFVWILIGPLQPRLN